MVASPRVSRATEPAFFQTGRRWLGPVAGLVALVLPAVALAQAAPVALILEVQGATQPALRPYREVMARTRVSLGTDGRLVFLDYWTCRTVTVVGGSVAFAAGAPPRIEGSAQRTDARGQCPRRVAASGAGAGVMLRSASPMVLTLPPTPSFVLIGSRADEFASVRLLHRDREVLAARLDGARFQWPAGAPPLVPAEDHTLVLLPKSGGAPVTLSFRTGAATPGPDEPLTLITVD